MPSLILKYYFLLVELPAIPIHLYRNYIISRCCNLIVLNGNLSYFLFNYCITFLMLAGYTVSFFFWSSSFIFINGFKISIGTGKMWLNYFLLQFHAMFAGNVMLMHLAVRLKFLLHRLVVAKPGIHLLQKLL